VALEVATERVIHIGYPDILGVICASVYGFSNGHQRTAQYIYKYAYINCNPYDK